MPDYLTIAQTYRIAGGYSATNVLNFVDIGGDFNIATMNNLVDLWGVFIFGSVNDDVIADGEVKCTLGFPDVTDEIISATDDHVGGSTGQLYSVSTSYNVNINAGATRRRKGRIFLPGVDEAKVEQGGLLTGTTAGDILTNLGTAITDMAVDEGWLLGVGSRADGVVRGAISVGVSNYVGSQRNRLARVSYAS